MQYIQRIEARLKEMGITAKKMLLDLGYSDSLISQWKKGSEPSAIKLSRISAYIELSMDYILNGIERESEIVSNSAIAKGHNSTAINGLSQDESDILKIYRDFDFDKRLKFLNLLSEIKNT